MIADAAADAEWGAPIGFVDLNHPATDDRVKLPTGAKAGDRLSAAWDAGGRVAVRVVDRGGFLGSRLEEHWYHDAAEVAWAWSIATNTRPIRLPGEVAGEPSDPFAAPLDPAVARRLDAWLARHEVTGFTGRTKAELWTAWCELSTSQRPGAWLEFDRAVRAAVDG